MSTSAIGPEIRHDRTPAPEPSREGQATCVVYSSFEEIQAFQREWDSAVERFGSCVYMTYDWLKTWWDFYGGASQLRLFVVWADGAIQSALPVYIERLGVGPFAFRVARLVGANIPPKVFDPPVGPAFVTLLFQHVMTVLFDEEKCDLLSYGPVSQLHQSQADLVEAARRRFADPRCVSVDQVDVHTWFRLPTTIEGYFEQIGKSESKRRKYELRAMSKDFEVREDVVCDPGAVEHEFEAFADQHRANWAAQGKPGHFGSWPKGIEYHRSLVRAQAHKGRVRFYRIHADGEVISRQYAYVCGTRAAWELPSRAMGGRWDKLSLGTAGVVRMFEAAIAAGVREVEGGIGHYEYKLRLGAEELPLSTVRIWHPALASAFRRKLWRGIQRGTRLAYQSVWHRRVMPRLPAGLHRPQPLYTLRLDY